jgi:hypothetical protein
MQEKTLLKENIADTIIAWMIFRKLLRKATDTEAYKLKLIDATFKILRQPKTSKEKEAMTVLDKLVFRIQHLLGPKITLIAYTGLMLSSFQAQKEATTLMSEKSLDRELQLDDEADRIADRITDITRLPLHEQEYILNKLVTKLLK